MKDNLKIILKTFKDEYDIKLKDTNIDNILGLKDLQLQPYIWRPYLEKEERLLQTKLKAYLFEQQRLTYNKPLTECVFQEYKNRYILVSYLNDLKESKLINSSTFSHIVITFYDAYEPKCKTIRHKLTKCGKKPKRYTRFRLKPDAIPEIFSQKFNEIGLYLNRTDNYQQIYTQRFLPMVYLINNNPKLTANIQGHHINYDTGVEIASKCSILPIREDLHTKEFHPSNIISSAGSKFNIAKGIMYADMLSDKYFKVKPKMYDRKVHENIFEILDLYFIQGLSISDIKRYFEQHKPDSKLAYNTIKSIVEHFKQYTPVLTKENIQAIKSNYLEKLVLQTG